MVSVLAVNTVEGMFDPWPVQIKEDIVVVIDIFFLVWQLNLQIPIQSVRITTKVVSSNRVHGMVYSIQHYVIKFVSDLWQVCGFLRVLRFPPPIKLTTAI